jgi:hypothetical protein
MVIKVRSTSGHKYMKKYSSLAIREMQVKITLRLHLVLVRMATIKETNNIKCWQEFREEEPLHALGGNVN